MHSVEIIYTFFYNIIDRENWVMVIIIFRRLHSYLYSKAESERVLIHERCSLPSGGGYVVRHYYWDMNLYVYIHVYCYQNVYLYGMRIYHTLRLSVLQELEVIFYDSYESIVTYMCE